MPNIKLTNILEGLAEGNDWIEGGSGKVYWGDEGAAGCIVLSRKTGRFLFGYRDKSDAPGVWAGFGGAIQGNEAPHKTAIRELKEETGYNGPLKLYIFYVYKDEPFEYYNYLAVVEDEFEPTLNSENANYAWVYYGEWPEPLHEDLTTALYKGDDKIRHIYEELVGQEDKETGPYPDVDPEDIAPEKTDYSPDDEDIGNNAPWDDDPNELEEMDAPPQQPPAIIQKAPAVAKQNVNSQQLKDAYVVVATVWGEAKGEGQSGMQAVLNVIMNRSKGDFNKAAGVALRPKQFSVWNSTTDPYEYSQKLAAKMRNSHGPDAKAYQTALALVDSAMKGKLQDITDGATFYFNPKKANPSWAKKLRFIKKIGNHDFYGIPLKTK